LMTSDEPMLRKAVAWAIREVGDTEAVERYLAWWAPRVKRGLLREATAKLPDESRRRLLLLAEAA
ncbi:MAG TPA: hypothetical protein ENI92_07620, partial [Bacteroidetes bacterium]|nr:hypothetical protein [Bacteroidota bacterium]